jgi:hypothetical protein
MESRIYLPMQYCKTKRLVQPQTQVQKGTLRCKEVTVDMVEKAVLGQHVVAKPLWLDCGKNIIAQAPVLVFTV